MVGHFGAHREHEGAVVPVRRVRQTVELDHAIRCPAKGFETHRFEIRVQRNPGPPRAQPRRAQQLHRTIQVIGIQRSLDALGFTQHQPLLDPALPGQNGPERLQPADLVVEVAAVVQEPGAPEGTCLGDQPDHRHHHDQGEQPDQGLHAPIAPARHPAGAHAKGLIGSFMGPGSSRGAGRSESALGRVRPCFHADPAHDATFAAATKPPAAGPLI
jgi:hypothetical protein